MLKLYLNIPLDFILPFFYLRPLTFIHLNVVHLSWHLYLLSCQYNFFSFTSVVYIRVTLLLQTSSSVLFMNVLVSIFHLSLPYFPLLLFPLYFTVISFPTYSLLSGAILVQSTPLLFSEMVPQLASSC